MPDSNSLADRLKAKQAALKQQEQAETEATKAKLKEALEAKHSATEQKTVNLAERLRVKQEAKAAEAKPEVSAAPATVSLSEEETAELTTRFDALKSRYEGLIAKVKLGDIVRDVTSLGSQIEEMPEAIDTIRKRGYVFHAYLEQKIGVVAEQWDEINDKVEAWLEKESEEFDDDIATAKALILKLSTGFFSPVHKGIANQLDTVLGTIEAGVSAAEEKISAVYDAVSREVYTSSEQVRKITQYLDWLNEASFKLQGGESLYIVAKAEWDDKKDKPEGFLYVTDRRMIFEQNEKTGKKLGMFGGKEVQQVLWEVPFSSIETVQAQDKGMFGGKDMMHLKMGAGAPYAEIVTEIKGGIDSKYWAKQVERAVKGLIREDSTVEADPELIERLRKAPTDCPSCSGVLPQIHLGATEVACQYCGTKIRI